MSDHNNTQLSEAPERIWIAPSTLKKRDGRIYLAPGRRDNEIEYVRVGATERSHEVFDAGFAEPRATVAAPQEDTCLACGKANCFDHALRNAPSLKVEEVAAGEQKQVQCADCSAWFAPDSNHTCRQQVRRNQRSSK